MLEARSITKSFLAVAALKNVDLRVESGEIHAVVGENGAGKSTLIRVIAGAYKPDAGSLVYDGRDVRWSSPHEARASGIRVVYQELDLLAELTVSENIFLAQEPTRYGFIHQAKIRRSSEEILRRLGVGIDPDAYIKDLPVADRQMVEVAKALAGNPKLLILDEPTAVLSAREVDLLFETLAALKDQGVAILYVSHRLEEVFRVSDRVTVLKDGGLVGDYAMASLTPSKLVSLMVGRDIEEIFPPKSASIGEEVLRVENLNVGGSVHDVTFSLRVGEVLGLAGLVGSGRTEVAQTIFGGMRASSGTITRGGACYLKTTPAQSIKRGIALLTEDRRGEGLIPNMSVKANLTASILNRFARFGFVNFKAEKGAAEKEMAKYAIATVDCDANVYTLSGGNQQKVLLSRWVQSCTDVLLLDEPTRGVDVGAKVEIYRIIRELADSGKGILMISSELPEIIGMCDRVLVMREGRVAGELSGSALTEEEIMYLATLGKANGVAGASEPSEAPAGVTA